MSEQPTKRKISFSTRVAAAFVVTAALTVLITASLIIIGWKTHLGDEFTTEDLYFAIGTAAVIALALSVAIGLYFASGIGYPVRKISTAAQALKAGDFSVRTGLQGDDELAELGKSFDEMADAIERDRDLERQLIGDVAHELRTPLMAIQATVEAMQDGVLPADEQRLATLNSETRRLGRLVDALLHLNRLENGRIEVRMVRLELSELVEELALTHVPLCENMGLKFTSQIESGVIINGDYDLVNQAITNMLSNAARYTPEGGSIHISLERRGGYAWIEVTDTGIGIAEDDIERVFSRFWRADSAREAKSGGMGIGLSLVKSVADQHRGSVSVESELGEGSTFGISFPLSPEDPMVQASDKQTKRRRTREARRKQDKVRKEQEKLHREQQKLSKEEEKVRKEQEKVEKLRQEQKAMNAKSASDGLTGALKRVQNTASNMSVFGIRMPIGSKKDNDGSKKS